MTRIGTVVARELLEALPAFVFFFVAFHMIAATKTVVLAEYEISWTNFSVATVGALIVAKAILLVEKTFVADLSSRVAIYNILWKSLVFSIVALAFRLAEEFIHAIGQAGSVAGAASYLTGSFSWPYFLVLQMWLFALLFLYCLAIRLIHIIGPDRAKAMLFGRSDGEP